MLNRERIWPFISASQPPQILCAPLWKQIKVWRERKKRTFPFSSFSSNPIFLEPDESVFVCGGPWALRPVGTSALCQCRWLLLMLFTPSPPAPSPLAFLLVLPTSAHPQTQRWTYWERLPWQGSRLGLVPALTVPPPGRVMKAAGGLLCCLAVLRFIIPATVQGSLIKTLTCPADYGAAGSLACWVKWHVPPCSRRWAFHQPLPQSDHLQQPPHGSTSVHLECLVTVEGIMNIINTLRAKKSTAECCIATAMYVRL